MNIVVTGGGGRLGRWVVADLVSRGHAVASVDISGDKPLPSSAEIRTADLTRAPEALESLRGAEAVVHLAAIPAPRLGTPEAVFATNVLSTWNVLQAAEALGVANLVLASSVNAFGCYYCRNAPPPGYFPVDEAHPTRAEESYSLSKWVGEELAAGFARRRAVKIASLRFHGIADDGSLAGIRRAPVSDLTRGDRMAFWGYVHFSDAAASCRRALEASWNGHEAFFIVAADTTLVIPTEEALRRAYPGVPLRRPLAGFATPFDISKAERMMGWKPERSWRVSA
ncbi:MAG: NAD(P)-dependent oxidoreductase [Planctomycetota bacterium]